MRRISVSSLVKEENIYPGTGSTEMKQVNPNRPTPRHIIIKMTKVKDKERILKAAKEKQRVMYERTSMKLSADFCAETLQGRRDGKIYSKG